MACGLACVVVDFGGPATLVGPDRGVKIPVGNVAQLTAAFRQELEQLVEQPARIAQLGLAAHRHAMTYYTWDAKARKTLEVYRWVTGRQSHKPDFWDQPA
jgi:glycosyltransferase involved in cell wall biosynthesis